MTVTDLRYLLWVIRSSPVIRKIPLSILLSLCVVLSVPTPATAQEDSSVNEKGAEEKSDDVESVPVEKTDSQRPATDNSIAGFRTPFEVLTERTIGAASKPVKFDWRRSYAQLGSTASLLSEFNNFDSFRTGGLLRLPYSGLLFETSLTYVRTWDTRSSRLLALTPYRQAARPSRFEIDFGVAYPLAEGVVTAQPSFFPAAELVFNAYGAIRYLIYPSAFSGLGFKDSAKAVFSTMLSEEELLNLEAKRLDSMEIDRARFGLMVGFSTDIYFQTGFFISPRFLLSIPPGPSTKLGFWWDTSISVGLAI